MVFREVLHLIGLEFGNVDFGIWNVEHVLIIMIIYFFFRFRDLRHDNIIAFRGMNTLECDVKHEKFTLTAGCPFLVMEYIPKNLYRFVEDHKTPESQGLPKSQVWTIGKGMASGLMYLHTLNPPISHRDLKPDNILVMIIIYYIYLYMIKAYHNNNI